MADNKNLPQGTIAEYVAGAKDMETRLYIMEKIKDKLENEKINLMCNIEKEKKEAENRYKEKKYHVSEYGKIMNKFSEIVLRLFYIGMFIIPGGIAGCVLTEASSFTIVFAVFFAIIMGTLSFNRDNGVEFRKKDEKTVLRETQEFKDAECNLKVVQHQCALKMKAVSILDAKITAISKATQIIKENINTYYRANIIPADYRRGVYMVAIDYVFRNGQANTLTEATLICDHHIRHIDIIEGSNDICNAYHCSANHVKDIEGKLSTIYAEIRKIALCQENPNEEFELTYYAAESTAKSAEYTEWCVRNHI